MQTVTWWYAHIIYILNYMSQSVNISTLVRYIVNFIQVSSNLIPWRWTLARNCTLRTRRGWCSPLLEVEKLLPQNAPHSLLFSLKFHTEWSASLLQSERYLASHILPYYEKKSQEFTLKSGSVRALKHFCSTSNNFANFFMKFWGI